jgi:hypothetical protein
LNINATGNFLASHFPSRNILASGFPNVSRTPRPMPARRAQPPLLFMSWSLTSPAWLFDRRFARPPSLGLRSALWLTLALGLLPYANAKYKWTAISPADLAAKDSPSAPGADSEIILSAHRMDADSTGTYTEHHIEAKIYTKKGVEKTGLFAIEHDKKQKVWDWVARVVKPDGTFTELTKSDFHESTALKTGGYEVLRTTFAFPNLQPGDVIEYRWFEAIRDESGYYYLQYCQAEEVPTREFVFDIDSARHDFAVGWYNCEGVEHQPKSHKVVIRNLPPFIPEPLMPTDTEFRGWIMVQFTSRYERFFTNDDAWENIGEYFAEQFRLDINPNAAVKAKASELTANCSSPEEKIAKLYAFAQSEIHNLDFFEDAAFADAKRKRMEEEEYQSSAKTLSRRTGTAADIDRLFAGLARASNFEVRITLSANRHRILTIKRPKGWVFTDRECVAVKIGPDWKFFTPGEHLVPAGILDTKDEGAAAFICDEKKSSFGLMQVAPARETQTKRTGHFSLDSEGTLEGAVEIQLTGHRAIRARDTWWNSSTEEINKSAREFAAERLPTAVVSDVGLDNLHDVTRPLVIHYKVSVPGYAEVIGTRLGLALNFFEANVRETFTNDTRRYPIFFDFAEMETDHIEIIIPDGFTLDGASAPEQVGRPEDVISARYGVKYLPTPRTLVYDRQRVLGKNGSIAFRAESYPAIRALEDRIHRSDSHQLVLKPKAAAAAQAPATPQPVVSP